MITIPLCLGKSEGHNTRVPRMAQYKIAALRIVLRSQRNCGPQTDIIGYLAEGPEVLECQQGFLFKSTLPQKRKTSYEMTSFFSQA